MDPVPLRLKSNRYPQCQEDSVPSFYSLFLVLDIDHVSEKVRPTFSIQAT